MRGFRRRLTRRFGWNLGPNETVNVSSPLEVSDAFRDLIAEENALDVKLYEFARQRYAA